MLCRCCSDCGLVIMTFNVEDQSEDSLQCFPGLPRLQYAASEYQPCCFVYVIRRIHQYMKVVIPVEFDPFVFAPSEMMVTVNSGKCSYIVEVENEQLTKGWYTVALNHKLGKNYTMLFASVRRHVFELFIFDEEGSRVKHELINNGLDSQTITLGISCLLAGPFVTSYLPASFQASSSEHQFCTTLRRADLKEMAPDARRLGKRALEWFKSAKDAMRREEESTVKFLAPMFRPSYPLFRQAVPRASARNLPPLSGPCKASYNSEWENHANFSWTQHPSDPYYATTSLRPKFSNISDPWAYYPTSPQQSYEQPAPPPPKKYSLDFQDKILQALEEFEANNQCFTQALHSQAQSLANIEAYANQIETAINQWDEKILLNNEQEVGMGHDEDAWKVVDIEQEEDIDYGENTRDVRQLITNFENSRVEEVVLPKKSVDSLPPSLGFTLEIMPSDQGIETCADTFTTCIYANRYWTNGNFQSPTFA
ncbi:hypothetical protein RHMOL_Rhmol10G0307500 [Rhododendron molle]|uniref:Uncharacterized protein n=1 Tax=Rhododendron molle TaxID=49168 RepID=A0ACC0M8I3_RHOML|nr:hypothetical protein RHMOL_Rhmol10G0307500 [Rhododendron molle]